MIPNPQRYQDMEELIPPHFGPIFEFESAAPRAIQSQSMLPEQAVRIQNTCAV
jgi:hypothetical protein